MTVISTRLFLLYETNLIDVFFRIHMCTPARPNDGLAPPSDGDLGTLNCTELPPDVRRRTGAATSASSMN